MTITRSSTGSVRQGTALVAALGLVMLVASTAYLMSTVLVSGYQAQSRRASQAAVLVTAESVANRAYQYYSNNSGSTDPTVIPVWGVVKSLTPPVDNNDADDGVPTSLNGLTANTTCQILADPTPGTPGDETYLITTQAASGNLKLLAKVDPTTGAWTPDQREAAEYAGREVKMLLTAHIVSFWDKGAFANNGYDWKGSASTDSYNSAEGPYGAKIYSNGDIASNGQLNVNNSGVHGTATSYANMFLPQLTYTPPATAVTVPSISSSYTFTAPGTYHTAAITIGKGNILRVQAGGGTVNLYVDGAMYFDGAQLQFDNTQSTLIVHQADNASSNGWKLNGNTNFGEIAPTAGGAVTQQSRPQQFQWYTMFSGQMDMNGTAQLSAVLYAPSATVKANGTFDYMGALIVNAFFTNTGQGQVNGNFKFHYDESLSALKSSSNPRLQVSGWFTRTMSFDEIKTFARAHVSP